MRKRQEKTHFSAFRGRGRWRKPSGQKSRPKPLNRIGSTACSRGGDLKDALDDGMKKRGFSTSCEKKHVRLKRRKNQRRARKRGEDDDMLTERGPCRGGSNKMKTLIMNHTQKGGETEWGQ